MSSTEHSFVRLSARALAPVVGLGTALMAVPAYADVPVGWSEPDAVSPLGFLLVVVGAPLALMVLIGLVLMAPGFTRGEGLTGKAAGDDDQWFGGRRQGVGEVGSGDSDRPAISGGASGSW